MDMRRGLWFWWFVLLWLGLVGMGGCRGTRAPQTLAVSTPTAALSPEVRAGTPTSLATIVQPQPSPTRSAGMSTLSPDATSTPSTDLCRTKFDEILAQHRRDSTQCDVALQALEERCPRPEFLRPASITVNMEIILDASGSMAQPTPDGPSRMQAAREALARFIRQLPREVNIALRVYGHVGSNREQDKPRSCAATELVYPFQPLDHDAFLAAVQRFQPTGWTPLALALDAARQDFRQLRAARGDALATDVLILVTDGEETCDGDPMAVARRLRDDGVQVYIIGLGLQTEAMAALQQVAASAEGAFYNVSTTDELAQTLTGLVNQTAWLEYLSCLRAYREDFLREQLAAILNAQTCYHRLATEEREAMLHDILALNTDPTYRVCVDPMLQMLEARQQTWDARQQRVDALFRLFREQLDRLNRLIDDLSHSTPAPTPGP